MSLRTTTNSPVGNTHPRACDHAAWCQSTAALTAHDARADATTNHAPTTGPRSAQEAGVRDSSVVLAVISKTCPCPPPTGNLKARKQRRNGESWCTCPANGAVGTKRSGLYRSKWCLKELMAAKEAKVPVGANMPARYLCPQPIVVLNPCLPCLSRSIRLSPPQPRFTSMFSAHHDGLAVLALRVVGAGSAGVRCRQADQGSGDGDHAGREKVG